MNPKRLLLIGGNFYPEPTGIGKYNGEMIDWLTRNGYDCTVVTTYPYYPQWKVQEPYTRKRYGYRKETLVTEPGSRNHFTVYRCPHYVPAQPTGTKRILSDLSFSCSALFIVWRLLFARKYDVVMTVAPPFHLGWLGVLYKRVRKATFLYHIQDLQIEAARDLGMIRSPWMLKILFGMERHILRQADGVSSICTGMIDKIAAKTRGAVRLFPNWANTGHFHPIADRASLKQRFGLDPDHKIVLYSGAIGEKQGLELILEAAYALGHHPEVRFLICGSGPYKERLANLAKGLWNVTFLPLQPLATFNEFLNMADVHLILQKSCAGDLLMPSKMTNILAVGGLSVVTADAGTSLHDTVDRHRIGLIVPSGNAAALALGIEAALYEDYAHIRLNARTYATQYLSIDGILTNYFGTVPGGYPTPAVLPETTPRIAKA